jgi:hypothetical protein
MLCVCWTHTLVGTLLMEILDHLTFGLAARRCACEGILRVVLRIRACSGKIKRRDLPAKMENEVSWRLRCARSLFGKKNDVNEECGFLVTSPAKNINSFYLFFLKT